MSSKRIAFWGVVAFIALTVGMGARVKYQHDHRAREWPAEPRGMSRHQAEAEAAKLAPIAREEKFGSAGGARVFAEKAVRLSLRTPATAKFPWGSTNHKQGPMGVWTVTGEVDAHNLGGALVRHDWTVRLHYSGGEWVVSDVKIIPR